MCRRLVCLICSILVLSFTSMVRGNVDLGTGLVAWWTFDEGAGTVAYDGSGNNNHATLTDGATWIQPGAPGKGGSAISLNGTSAYLRVEHSPSLNLSNAATFEMWVYGGGTPAKQIIGKGNVGDGTAWWSWCSLRLDNDPPYYRQINFRNRVGENANALNSNTAIPTDEWTHIAVTFDVNAPGNNQKIYINGRLDAESRSTTPLTQNTGPIYIGADPYAAAGRWWWNGMIDEGSIYNRALNAVEIKTIAGVKYTTDPSPKDGVTISNTSVTLQWYQGANVADINGHHVYFADQFADVNSGAVNTDKGFTTDPSYDVSNLVPGMTYYWRIDEVNDAHPDKVWRGDVWSFTVAAGKAYYPSPSDGAIYVGRNRTLSWAAGTGAISHRVYFGIDQIKAAAGANDADKGTLTVTDFSPGVLTHDTTYYWRVDEFDGVTTHEGDVWSFVTTASGDPNLIGWWPFEDGYFDISGNENHGRLINDANIVIVDTRPYADETSVLNLNGTDECVYIPYSTSLDIYNAVTVAMWAYGGVPSDRFISKGGWNNVCYTFRLDGTARNIQWRGTSAGNFLRSTSSFPTAEWTHVAITFDVNAPGNNQRIYVNGAVDAENRSTNPLTRNLYYVAIGGRDGASHMWAGMLDDVRIYNRALTASEVQIVMAGDPNLARNPKPASGSGPDEKHATPLSWTAGVNAVEHDVYFGTDRGAVQNASPSDPLGVYSGRQSATSYTPPAPLQWGQTYYWRIDEVNDLHPGSPWKGNIWSFTVTDYLVVDDFEDYDAGANQIWYSWHDGLGYGIPGTPPYFAGNATGAAVGDETTASFTEETIIHGGKQSMPVAYDNNKQGKAKYSEVEMTLPNPQDWTRNGVGELSVWFRGHPASVGSFTEAPAGTYTITAAGADIWNQADQFHYAFKTLTGVGSIEAQVLSVDNTDPWAKAGVMIRETLEPGSKFAAVYITPGNGCRFQARMDTSIAATSDSGVVTNQQTAITAPYWVKLDRDFAGNFRGYYSADGTTWIPMMWNPQNITMNTNVYVGLALTGHNNNATCTAKFSNVKTTGTVSAQWAHQDIGIASNAAEPLYVAVSNAAGQPAVVVHPDTAAAQITTWTEWVIPLQSLATQGITLSNVDRIAVGLGTRGNQTTPGGSGKMYFDDIRLYRPRTAP